MIVLDGMRFRVSSGRKEAVSASFPVLPMGKLGIFCPHLCSTTSNPFGGNGDTNVEADFWVCWTLREIPAPHPGRPLRLLEPLPPLPARIPRGPYRPRPVQLHGRPGKRRPLHREEIPLEKDRIPRRMAPRTHRTPPPEPGLRSHPRRPPRRPGDGGGRRMGGNNRLNHGTTSSKISAFCFSKSYRLCSPLMLTSLQAKSCDRYRP